MHKILMCISLLFNTLNFGENIEIKKVEYDARENDDMSIKLNIDIHSIRRDIVELRVFFDDENNYYSKALVVEGEVFTTARIPMVLDENIVLKLEFYSVNLDKIFANINFPVYKKIKSKCDIMNDGYCKSGFPTKVIYVNNEIKEIYDEIALISKNKVYYSFDNTLPLDKISFNSNEVDFNKGNAAVIIKDRIDEMNIYYNEGYVLPLDVHYKNKIISFSLAHKYYVDLQEGKVYEDYKSDTIYENEIIFPYRDGEYNIQIVLINFFASLDEIEINLKLKTNGMLIGECKVSKYCIRRNFK